MRKKKKRLKEFFRMLKTKALKEGQGCVALGISIVELAFFDVLPGASNVSQRDREDAVKFLTSTANEWMQHRQLICDIAGLDADWVRTRGKEIIKTNIRRAGKKHAK